MNVTAHGSLLIGKGETLSVQAGPFELLFSETPPPGTKPNEHYVHLDFSLSRGQVTGGSGGLAHDGVVYCRRTAIQHSGLPGTLLVTYTIAPQQ